MDAHNRPCPTDIPMAAAAIPRHGNLASQKRRCSHCITSRTYGLSHAALQPAGQRMPGAYHPAPTNARTLTNTACGKNGRRHVVQCPPLLVAPPLSAILDGSECTPGLFEQADWESAGSRHACTTAPQGWGVQMEINKDRPEPCAVMPGMLAVLPSFFLSTVHPLVFLHS
ncbi:hypothetical protein MRX96_042019 [Rhipicephalus microplus]